MSIAGVGAYTVGATILCALTTTASNVHAMMGMVNEALWTEPNGPTVGCIHESAHPGRETTRAVPKEFRYGKRRGAPPSGAGFSIAAQGN